MTPRPIERYLADLARGLGALPAAQRDESLREVRLHLEEAAAAGTGADPAAREAEAVARFGPADEIARAMTAEALLAAATRSFHPLATARALAHAFAGGAAWTLFALLFSLAYVALLLLAVVSITRLWLPDAGLWIHPDGSWSLSFGGFALATEVLGPWLPLYGPLLALAGWWVLHRAARLVLRLARARRVPGAAP